METVLSICLGIGLSAACGFRVFVPLLIMSIASMSGHLQLASGFAWISTYPALITFAVATVLEIGGYYIPWLGHLLDTMTTPAAIVAGTIATAAMVTGMSPMLKWTLAIIAGGGAAGLVQGTTVVARGVTNMGTAGLATPLVSTIELGASLLTSIVAVIAPVLGIVFLIAMVIVIYKVLRRMRKTELPIGSQISTVPSAR